MKEIKLLVKNRKLGKYMVFAEGTYSNAELNSQNSSANKNGAITIDKMALS